MSVISTPEKKAGSPKKTPTKKTPTKKTPTKKTPKKGIHLNLENEGRKVKFSPKVMLYEGKMSLSSSTSGLPSKEKDSVGKKSNLKKRVSEGGGGGGGDGDADEARKTLDFDGDKKVAKLKQKIKQKREIMRALNSTGAIVKGHRVLLKKDEKGGKKGVNLVVEKIGDDTTTTTKKKKKKKLRGGKAEAAKSVDPGDIVLQPKKEKKMATKKKKEATVLTPTMDVTSFPIEAAHSPGVKGDKRKREDSDEPDVAEKKPAKKPKRLVDAESKSPAKKAVAGEQKKKPKGVSARVYKKVFKKKTLSENQLKLSAMKKKERKAFRQKRKMGDEEWGEAVELKRIWEVLRRENLEEEKRTELCGKLFEKVKGRIRSLSFMHDCSRVIQCLIKHATRDQIDAIFQEIKGEDLVAMSKNKYAKNVVKRIMDRGTKEQRDVVVAAFKDKVPEIAKHADASAVLDYSVSNFTNATQRRTLVEEFYGPSYAFHKTEEHQTLEALFAAKPEARDSILDHVKRKILGHADKESFTTQVVQAATLEFLRVSKCKPELRQEVIESTRDAVVHVLHTHVGARIAMHALWHGTAKDRKVILKSFKGHVVTIATNEHGYQVLLAAIDVTDDTKMMSKSLVEELASSPESLEAVIASKHGRTVLFYLVHHRDSRHVHPDLLAILKDGDGNAASKKDPVVRRRELAAASLPHLLRHVAANAARLLASKPGAVALYTILEGVVDGNQGADVAFDALPPEVGSAFDAVIDLVAAPFEETNEEHPVADAGGHLCVKKLLLTHPAFASRLSARVSLDSIVSWTRINRGCFVVLALLQVSQQRGADGEAERLKTALKAEMGRLEASDVPGAKLLVEKLR